MSVPKGAGSLAKAMITVTEVYHTLKFAHQEGARRFACHVGDKTGFLASAKDSNEPLYFLTNSFELDQYLATLRMKSRIMNAKCLLFATIPKNVQPNSVPKLPVTGNVPHHDRAKRSLGFFQNVTMTSSMMNGHEVLVRASLLMVQVPLVSVLTAASLNPLTIQAALTSSLLFHSR